MRELQVTPSEILSLRRAKNKELFAQVFPDVSGDISLDTVELLCQVEGCIVLKSRVSILSNEWLSVAPFVNKPVVLYDKRITTHNLSSASDWPLVDGSPKSAYKITPDPGLKLLVTHIQVRFPSNAKLIGSTKLYCRVYLNMGAGLVPVMNLEYTSMYDLIKKANSPILVQPRSISSVSTSDLVELEFKYADPNSLEGAPISLRSAKGEYIEIGIIGDDPIINVNGEPLSDKCWAVVNGKQCVDF